MLVQWSSRDAPRPEVRWGADAERLNRTTAADSDSYDADDLCGPPATTAGWLEPGLLHRALLTDLQPDTEYWYKYGDEVLHRSDCQSTLRWSTCAERLEDGSQLRRC